MSSADVVDFYTQLQNLGIVIWLDGGWAVDALLGEQTRPHEDLDIAIQEKDVSKVCELLESQGYKDVPRDDTGPWSFVLGDDKGHEIDFHIIVFDDKGNGIYGPLEKKSMYPAASLIGKGTLDGRPVKCISAEYMVKFMAPWLNKHGAKYVKAISALCERFDIDYPAEYRHLKKSDLTSAKQNDHRH